MKDYMIERVNAIADYILETGCTVRTCAAHFKVSKTTVHKDMRERLKKLNPEKARSVSRVLDGNREERHLRGGNATRLKYAKEANHSRVTSFQFFTLMENLTGGSPVQGELSPKVTEGL